MMQEKLQYTTGPWAVKPEEVDKNYIRIRGVTPGGKYKIANVICSVGDTVEPKESRANAKLIAKAPEMLEALQRIENNWRTDGDIAGAMADARNILCSLGVL